MKIKEVIELLQTLDQDMEMFIEHDWKDYCDLDKKNLIKIYSAKYDNGYRILDIILDEESAFSNTEDYKDLEHIGYSFTEL